jgi:hypothetical protein
MHTLIDWSGVITSLPSCILSLAGGWYFGARYSEMSNRRRTFNDVALRVREAIRPALSDGRAGRVDPIDWDHLLHLLGRRRAKACQQARAEYQNTLRAETAADSSGGRFFRNPERVIGAAQRWFDLVSLR